MLGSVKSQMTNWIGGNIVGFRKTSESGNSDNNVIAESEDARIIDDAASNKELLKDDDNSRYDHCNSVISAIKLNDRCF